MRSIQYVKIHVKSEVTVRSRSALLIRALHQVYSRGTRPNNLMRVQKTDTDTGYSSGARLSTRYSRLGRISTVAYKSGATSYGAISTQAPVPCSRLKLLNIDPNAYLIRTSVIGTGAIAWPQANPFRVY